MTTTTIIIWEVVALEVVQYILSASLDSVNASKVSSADMAAAGDLRMIGDKLVYLIPSLRCAGTMEIVRGWI